MVRQRADDGRANKISQAKGRRHHQKSAGLLVVAVGESANDVRQDRHHQTDRDHVDQDRDQDKGHGRLALLVVATRLLVGGLIHTNVVNGKEVAVGGQMTNGG